MHGAHAARPTRKRTSSRKRLIVVILAPAVVLLPLTAQATIGKAAKPAKTVAATAKVTKPAAKVTKSVATLPGRWRKSWSPALDLTVIGAQANFVALRKSMASLASQKVVSTATFRTNWVDVRALTDGPNIAQQGLSVRPPQFKLQIAHGPNPTDHRGNCHIDGATGHVLAYGPRIDVADGQWHTITCIKFPDTARGTEVIVIVDGVAGTPKWSHTPIGDVIPNGAVRLGGRSSKASTDSLDGWISRLSYTVT
jgi:hypothetical protein